MKAPTTALRNALADWLQTKLATNFPTVKVMKTWPQPGRTLPEFAVSVLVVPPIVVMDHEPVVWSTVQTTVPNGTTIYSYGTATVSMQLDCWARYPDARDSLAEEMRKWLNRSPLESLGISSLPFLGSHPGLVLALPDFANVTAEYRFGQIATPIENTGMGSTQEWRATWNGSAYVYLINQESVALMKQINLSINNDNYVVE